LIWFFCYRCIRFTGQ